MQKTIIRKYIIKKYKKIVYKVKEQGRDNANTRFL